MSNLHLDFETRSAVDLKKAGVYVYAADETTDAWCAAYSMDDGPIELWTPDGDSGDVRYALKHADKVTAHNASFERVINQHMMARRYDWPVPRLEQWRCTMTMALAMALPGSLENAAAAVGLPFQKDMDGHNTMMRMAKPRRPRKGELPDGVYYFDDDERKQKLYAYCKNDVLVERELEKRLNALRPAEQSLWHLDQVINDRGVFVDTALCDAAVKIVDQAAGWLDDEMRDITKGFVSACSNVGQIGEYLRTYGGLPDVDSIAKGEIDELLSRRDLSPTCRRVLELRREAAKASVAKISALLAGKSADGRARGLLQYHAASTGRWAGRRFQPQNLPRGSYKDSDAAVAAVQTGDAELVTLLYGEPLNVVSSSLRGMIRAAPGSRLLVADFSNIEGRLIAWYGNEEWKLNAFRDYDAGVGPDIYKLTASEIIRTTQDRIVAPNDVTDAERQGQGKVPELALGFAGGRGAFLSMASIYGVKYSDDQVEDIKLAWRGKHPGVVSYWYELERGAIEAVKNRGKVVHVGRIAFRVAGSFCYMRLPSGRAIVYPYPCIKNVRTPWGKDKPSFSYKGVDPYTRKWTDQYAHGGVLFNNVVQGTARDVEAEAMVRTEAAGYPNVLSVHDEIVAERAIGEGTLSEFQQLMTTLPDWADGLPVTAGAFEAERYRK
jgi:DNA polymerase bacteriophage-type